MFILSQLALRKLNICDYASIPTYSVAIGLVIYACMYTYLLYYKPQIAYVFNKFVIYIIGIDLLLSSFVYVQGTHQNQSQENMETKQNTALLNDESNTNNVQDEEVNEDNTSQGFSSDLDIESTEESIEEDYEDKVEELGDETNNSSPVVTKEKEEVDKENFDQIKETTESIINEIEELQETTQPNQNVDNSTEPVKRKRGRPPKIQLSV